MQAVAFAELLAGGVLLTSAITGHSPGEVMEGVGTNKSEWVKFGAEPSNNLQAAQPAEPANTNTSFSPTGGGGSNGPLAPPPSVAAKNIPHRGASSQQILSLDNKLAKRNQHLTKATISRLLKGSLDIRVLESQLGI